tara:strand:+ start:53 stop:385 length:333 start_codon:yes stop_codon:yes gene_type:complete
MFVVKSNPTFTHTVKVKVPVDGGFSEQSFRATFNVVPVEEAAKFDLSDGAESKAFLVRAIASMDDLVGPDGKTKVEYSDALRDELLAWNYVRKALATAYFDAISGARAGN